MPRRRLFAWGIDARIRQIRDRIHLFLEVLEDGWRHARYSAPTDAAAGMCRSERHLETQLTKDYHRIEKGLALSSPRQPFGQDVYERLLRTLERYRRTDRPNPELIGYCTSAIADLAAWNSDGRTAEHATRPHMDVVGLPDNVRDAFFGSRSSLRSFDRRAVSKADVKEAVSLAMNTPSVCNRQAWRTYVTTTQAARESVLALQNGNAGFRSEIPCVLAVTVDARLFSGAGERNQRWIDGGLFAMSLVWALHSKGLGTCMLNWSVSNAQSRRLRSLLGIAEHEDVIMLIAVGYPSPTAVVARSPRRSLEEVFIDASPIPPSA